MPLFGALALTGLAGSLHCVGMCGPILLGLSRSLPTGRSFSTDALAYHLGRLWTYALLGLIAGSFGRRLELAWGGRRAFAFALGGVVIVNGLLVMRRARSRLEQRLGAALGGLLRRLTAVGGLGGQRGFAARVLVGAVMGLTPCGMVWMALVPAAALGNPLLSAAGMLAFGLGTLPALSGVVVIDRLLATRLRRHGRTLAAIALILAGIWMLGRAIPGEPGAHDAHSVPHEHASFHESQ
ncbi:MAG: sulfite exporter TauE/SafE family protein [Acidobacteria bacterium]|nr:sulfite exporter TauE/SafE family protein [Acidobacteriota bacterium]